MAIDTNDRLALDYFIGTEVEHTAMKGELTLFVVGIKPVNEILDILKTTNGIRHIYFGTSQSFTPNTSSDWQKWDKMITPLLKQGYWVTLDFDVKYADELHEEGWCEYNTFIPMISVKLPYIRLYNYNATIKIDDQTWGKTNPGVWCHPLNELMTRDVYTDWKDYVGDQPIYTNKADK
jgi:hypothetical protein